MKLKRIIKAMALTLVMIGVFSAGTALWPRHSEAVTASDWKAGRIIDDSIFFNGGLMSESQIQSFLNSKMPNCDTNGTKNHSYYYKSSTGRVNNSNDTWVTTTRAIYGSRYDSWYGVNDARAPYSCLRNYTAKVPAKAADSYCTKSVASSGSTKKSAAYIIKVAAAACNVSPQAILVTLQKEQSLVTDDWPWKRQFTKATGYGCPDSSLSTSVDANQNGCYDQYEGFFNQIYWAARTFQRYAKDPEGTFNHYTGNYSVRYHPNASCGSTVVNIQTKATAGLYNYTPYQPNKAALDNMYGTGNGCSAYGNRNFWRMFNDWFGSTNYLWAAEISEKISYSDSSRTTTASITPLRSGETRFITIRVKNTGTKTWQRATTKIGTASTYNRTSIFQDGSWLSVTRPAQLVESSVAFGQTGTFKFALTAPITDGQYKEAFRLVVQDGGKDIWLRDKPSFSFTISVSNPYNAQIIQSSTYADNTTNKPIDISRSWVIQGKKIYVLIKAKNVGSQTWGKAFTKVGTTRPNDRESIFADSSWLSGSRPATMFETTVAPGQTGTFKFAVMAPDTVLGTYSEYFQLVADGQSHPWMPSGKFSRKIHIVTAPPNKLTSGVRLYKGYSYLKSSTDKYELRLRNDGNVTLYSHMSRKNIWSSKTAGKNASYLEMHKGGNLILKGNSGTLWSTKTGGNSGSRLYLRNDGNLVIQNASGKIIWQTGTKNK